MKRRTVLAGAISCCLGLAGCSEQRAAPSMLSLSIFNHSESSYKVELTLLREGGDSRSDVRAFSASIAVEADGHTRREDIVEERPYTIEYSLYEGNSLLTDQDHVHYYPTGSDTDDTLAVDIDSDGVLTRR